MKEKLEQLERVTRELLQLYIRQLNNIILGLRNRDVNTSQKQEYR